jgi:hypothetical protein
MFNGPTSAPRDSVKTSTGNFIITGLFTSYQGSGMTGLAQIDYTNANLVTSYSAGTGFNTGGDTICIQSDDKVIVAGGFSSYNGTNCKGAIRINTDATIDNTWSYPTVVGFSGGSVYDSIVQASGKVILVGDFTSYSGYECNRIVRLNTDGTIDSTFNSGTGLDGLVRVIKQDSSGFLYLGGDFTRYNGDDANSFVKLSVNGSIKDCTITPAYTPTPTTTSTPTPSVTKTQTPTVTPTNTSTQTPTPTITANASGLTEANTYLAAVLAAGGTGITATVSAATQTLFVDLVYFGFWDKLSVFYPMLGGTSNSIAVQGKNPGTNNFTFNGGWTFNSSGATGNGTNAWANTSYKDSSTLRDNFHMSVYSFTEKTNTNLDCGVFSTTANSRTAIYCRETTTAGYAVHNANTSNNYAFWTNTGNTGAGLYAVDRNQGNVRNGYRNGTRVVTQGNNSTATCSLPYVLGARINDSSVVDAYSNRGYSWFSIGKSLTQTEHDTFSDIINEFQTTLGRNTY